MSKYIRFIPDVKRKELDTLREKICSIICDNMDNLTIDNYHETIEMFEQLSSLTDNIKWYKDKMWEDVRKSINTKDLYLEPDVPEDFEIIYDIRVFHQLMEIVKNKTEEAEIATELNDYAIKSSQIITDNFTKWKRKNPGKIIRIKYIVR